MTDDLDDRPHMPALAIVEVRSPLPIHFTIAGNRSRDDAEAVECSRSSSNASTPRYRGTRLA
jgi:hypothetical protein